MTARMTRRSRTLIGAAFVAAVVSLGMTVHPSPAGAAVGGNSLSPGASLVACTGSPPPAGWTLRRTIPEPDACRLCEAEGGALEATGNFRAWCHSISHLGVVALYVYCVGCRDGEAPEATSARFDDDGSSAGNGRS